MPPPRRPLALLAGLALLGCSGYSAPESTATVFAAASLTAPFQAVAQAFEARHPGARIELHFAGSAQLVVQIREGARADVFASADEPSMQRVVEAGHTAAAPRVFARYELCIVTPRGNPKGVEGLADLARDDVTVLLCGPGVPAGRYARQMLARASLVVRPASDEPSVKAVVSKVGLGEADAGVVYVTDAASARERVDAVHVPAEENVTATYPIAVLDSGDGGSTGAAFVAFVLSPDGRAVLESFGFAAP